MAKEKKDKKPQDRILTPQQESFCQLYVKNESLYGNATHCYAEAYKYDLESLSRIKTYAEDGVTIIEDSEYDKAYRTCAVMGGRLLRSMYIQNRLTKLLNEMLTDEMVDSQLAKVILQDHKMESKVGAIREYNKLKKRITDKVELSGSLSLAQLFDKAKDSQ